MQKQAEQFILQSPIIQQKSSKDYFMSDIFEQDDVNNFQDKHVKISNLNSPLTHTRNDSAIDPSLIFATSKEK